MKANQIRIHRLLGGVVASVVLAAVAMTGCSKPAPKGPSYAEALAIYNDEVQALDRLKEQRSKLQQQLDSPPPTSDLDAAALLLGNTADLSKEISGAIKDLAGPNSPVGGEEAQRRQDELIGSVTDQIEKAKASQKQKTEEWEAKKKKIVVKVADLKKQIAEQKKRVERAKADKLAAEAARAEIGAGADVLTGTAQMVVGAVGVAKDEGVPWFGTQADQTQLAPSVVVASQVYHWEVVMKEIIDLMGKGTMGGRSEEHTSELQSH